MAHNFKFLSDHIKNKICVRLYGDFDGSSACELINVLKSHTDVSGQIFIDTDSLNTIYPFGLYVFKKNLSFLNINIKNIIITGKNRFSLEQGRFWITFKLLKTTSLLNIDGGKKKYSIVIIAIAVIN